MNRAVAHSEIKTGVFYNRDLFQNRGATARQLDNAWGSVIDNLSAQEKEAILKDFIKHNAKKGLARGALHGAVGAVKDVLDQYSNIALRVLSEGFNIAKIGQTFEL